MEVEIVLAIFLIRFLRKSLQTHTRMPEWDRILVIIMVISVTLLGLGISGAIIHHVTRWLTHAVLLSLAYLIFYRQEFQSGKPYMNMILPYVGVSVVDNLVELINAHFYQEWETYFDAARFFAIVWMVAMWFITKKQRKALELEKLKTLQREQEIKITGSLKDALEVQVAERTAELTQQKEELQMTLDELKSTQSLLVHSVKMASLGELTAGIAHEIQNPLNFVNNFSEVNTELIEEMKNELKAGNTEEAIAIANDIAENEQKITQHGKRADAIVKGMLQHSRTSSGTKEPTDINALTDEYLRLAYHGLRAKDKSFNATLKTDYDTSIGNVNIFPQDMGRVILNLITNAFYSVTEKKILLSNGLAGLGILPGSKQYEPTVSVSTKKTGNRIEIGVRDNGQGISQKVQDKIFQPFFTTKPTGQGTGLGLSLSYDIVKAHGGEIKVETKEGEGAGFFIRFPLA